MTCEVVGGQVQVDVTCERRPAIYLDQFALHHFATVDEDRHRFLNIFATRGELLFSSANVAEAVQTSGASLESVCGFLDAIGPHWVPIDIDVWAVLKASRSRSTGPHPALDGKLLEIVYEVSRGRPDEIWLGNALRVFRSHFPDGQFFRETMAVAKARSAERVAALRLECRGAPGKAPVVTDQGRVVHIATALIRAIVVDEARSFSWMPNDIVDFAHAMMPLAWADAIFLDKAWKRRVERVAPMLPPDLPRIYYGPQSAEFLLWLESAEFAAQ